MSASRGKSCSWANEYDPVQKRVFSCAGFLFPDRFGAQKECFPHRKLWRGRFSAKKSVFLHQKSSPAENGAQMGRFLHRKQPSGENGGQEGHLLFLAVFLLILHFVC